MMRKLAAEFLGTAILVFFAVGVATLMFGFRLAGASAAAGVVATAFAFGLTLLALVYMIGPISGRSPPVFGNRRRRWSLVSGRSRAACHCAAGSATESHEA